MSTTNDLKLARVVKVVLDILFGALVFACLALVLWMVFSPLIIRQAGILGTASVPVTLGGHEEPSQFDVTFTSQPGNEISHAFVEGAEGTLRLETSSVLLIVTANAAILVSAVGLAYVFYLLRAIVQAILDREPFTSENVRRVRRLGYAVLAVGLLRPSVEYIASTEVLRFLPASVPALNPGPTFDVEVILTTLLILLLAHIWAYGLELERDKALTV